MTSEQSVFLAQGWKQARADTVFKRLHATTATLLACGAGSCCFMHTSTAGVWLLHQALLAASKVVALAKCTQLCRLCNCSSHYHTRADLTGKGCSMTVKVRVRR